jgi:hypothetical protein
LFFPDYTLEAALIAVDLARRLNPLNCASVPITIRFAFAAF